MKIKEFYELCLVVILLLVIYLLGYITGMASPMEQKIPITPELRIEVKNGITDTTYIYKRINCQPCTKRYSY